ACQCSSARESLRSRGVVAFWSCCQHTSFLECVSVPLAQLVEGVNLTSLIREAIDTQAAIAEEFAALRPQHFVLKCRRLGFEPLAIADIASDLPVHARLGARVDLGLAQAQRLPCRLEHRDGRAAASPMPGRLRAGTQLERLAGQTGAGQCGAPVERCDKLPLTDQISI